jgi:hypothetical protein
MRATKVGDARGRGDGIGLFNITPVLGGAAHAERGV